MVHREITVRPDSCPGRCSNADEKHGEGHGVDVCRFLPSDLKPPTQIKNAYSPLIRDVLALAD